jgi:hypothetical protein
MATPPDFAVGQVLTAAHMDAVGFWRITDCTVSSAGGTAATASNGVITVGTSNTSVTVSNAFSSNFASYKIIVSGTGVGSTNINLGLSLGAANSGYYAGYTFTSYGTSSASGVSDSNAASFTRAGQASTTGISLNLDLINPQIAARTLISGSRPTIATTGENVAFAGYLNDATAYTAFTLTCSTGNISGGQIRVYGYRN